MRVLSTLLLFLVLFTSAFAQVGQQTVYIAPEGKFASPCDLNLDTEESITSCIKSVFGANSRVALAVAKAESQLNPNAVHYNGKWSKDCGVFQINNYYYKSSCQLSTKDNILLAYDIYNKHGWKPWVAYNTGAYLKYLE